MFKRERVGANGLLHKNISATLTNNGKRNIEAEASQGCVKVLSWRTTLKTVARNRGGLLFYFYKESSAPLSPSSYKPLKPATLTCLYKQSFVRLLFVCVVCIF